MSDDLPIETMGEALQEFFRGRSIEWDRQRGWLWRWIGLTEEMSKDDEDTLLYLLDHYVNGDWPGGDE